MVKRLLILNGLATLGAVIHHAITWNLTAMFWWADRYLPVSVPYLEPIWGLRYAALRVIDQFAFPGVFAFLIVSGYFTAITATDNQSRVNWNLILRRIKNLLLPYLVWSFVYIVFNLLQDKSYSPLQIARILLTGGIAAPFFYVPLLIQLYLLAPLLVPVAKRQPWLLLGGAILLQVPITLGYYLGIFNKFPQGMEPLFDLLRNWHLLSYMVWFVIGIMLGLYMQSIKRLMPSIRLPLLVALILVSAASIAEWEFLRQASGKEWLSIQTTISGKLFALLLFLSFFVFDRVRIPFSSQVSQIGIKSYGIYLIHALFLELVARGIYRIAPQLLAYQMLLFLLLCAVGLGAPLLMMRIVDGIQPLRRFYGYLFG